MVDIVFLRVKEFVTISACSVVWLAASPDGCSRSKDQSSGSQNGGLLSNQTVVLTSARIEVFAPDERCAHGGIKLLRGDLNSSQEPLYACSQANERIYRVEGTDLLPLPATGTLKVCASDAQIDCLASGSFRAVNTGLLDKGKIVAGTKVAGVSGTLAECSSDAQTGCVSVDAFKAVDMTKVTEGNIKKGVVLGGVTGAYPSSAFKLSSDTATIDLPAFASTAGGTTYEWFTADGTLISGTIMPDQSVMPQASPQNLNGGLYRNVTIQGDSDLTSANISSGVQVFSVTGTASARPQDCATDGATNCVAVTTFPAADISDKNGAAIEWSIVKGVTLGGRLGKAHAGSLISTGAHRDVNSTPGAMTYAQEISLGSSVLWRTITSGQTGFGYREVPIVTKDDDGFDPAGVNLVAKLTRDANGSTWGGTTTNARKVCGKNASSVASKIIACENEVSGNPNATPWNGHVKGISGEGSWTLVTVYNPSLSEGATCGTGANTCYEVWRDDRTGILWSDRLADTLGGSSTYNWCHASGANNSASISAAYTGFDPHGYCAPVAAQGAGTVQPDPPVSLCFEDNGFGTSSSLAPMKGNMHKTSAANPSTIVKWRIPTMHDFNVAEHNGIRHVLPNMESWFWSATTLSDARHSAWRFDGWGGSVGYKNHSDATEAGVRCVGIE